MGIRNEKTVDLYEELAYRSGFRDGAEACLNHMRKLIEAGFSWVDAEATLREWASELEKWARGEDLLDPNGEIRHDPPRP